MKKIIALILVLATVLSMNILVLGTSAAEEENVGPYTIENEKVPEGATVTEIKDADGFAAISGNGIYVIAADNIEITASNENTFNGTIYGCGKTIKTTQPLFKTLDGAKIYDLKIEASIAETTYTAMTYDVTNGRFVGALARFAYDSTIKNVDVSGSVRSGKVAVGSNRPRTCVGGIAGIIDNCVVSYCDNSAATTVYNGGSAGSQMSAGGIAGCIDGSSTLSYCTNSGVISALKANNYKAGTPFAGGMAGTINLDKSTAEGNKITIEYCINSGEIEGVTAAGGLVGRANSDSGAKHYYKNNTNTGNVTANHAAGMVAYNYIEVEITDCDNLLLGNITAVAGTAGGMIGTSSGKVTMKDCDNTGTITNKSNIENGMTGGIVGTLTGDNSSLTSCTNNGDVIGYSRVGGVVGYANAGNITVSGCKNTKAVSVVFGIGYSFAGGIVGAGFDTGLVIENCTNEGKISSTDVAGGILGYYSKTDATVSYCLNSGEVVVDDKYIDIDGNEQTRQDAVSRLGAGGIVGHLIDTGKVKVEYCGVTGNVSVLSNLDRSEGNGDNAGIGGIIAYAQAEGTSVTNSFFTGELVVEREKEICEDEIVGLAGETTVEGLDSNHVYGADAPEVVGGKLAFLMQDENEYWGQDIRKDMHPVLNGADGAKVKKFGEADVYYEGDLYKNVALGEKFIVQYFVDGYDYDAENGAKATFTFLGVNKDVVAVNGEGDYAYQLVFKFDKIAPQFIGEEIAVTFSDSDLTTEPCTTVKHLEDTAKEYADNAKLQDLIKAAICYGYEAREYVKEDSIAVIESTDYMGDLTGDMPEDNMELSNSSESVAFKAANINFNDVNKLYFRYKADAESIVTIKATKKSNGEAVEFDAPVLDKEGEYIVYSAPIMACDYDDQFVVELYDDGVLAATLTYGIYDYAARMQTNSTVGNLAKATYFYGYYANEYAAK